MNNNAPVEQLEIAENPNTPATQLVQLALTENVKILKAIACNPNTPPNLLVELSGEFLEEIGENPTIELILMENPNFIENIFDRHKDSTYCHPETYLPLWYLEKAKKHSNRNLRRLVARSEHTPISFLKKLIKDPEPFVRAEVIFNDNTPTSLLFKAVLDRDKSNRQRARGQLFFRTPDTFFYLVYISVLVIMLNITAFLIYASGVAEFRDEAESLHNRKINFTGHK